MQKLLLLLISVLVLNSNLALSQCLLTPISTTDKVINASVIIEGKVIAKKSFWDSKHKLILTKNKIEVYKVFKGTVSGKTIDIITEGGVVGNDMLVVEPSLQLELNDVGVFTCVPTKAKIPFGQKSVATQYDAYASVQGFIKYDLDNLKANSVFDSFNDINSHLYPTITSITQKPYTIIKKVSFTLPIQNQLQSNPAITNISPTTATAGTKTVLTITGTGFGTTQGVGTVGFKNADNGGSSYINPHSTQYLSWSDTQIQVEIPTKAGTGIIQVTQGSSATSTQTLTINYAHLNVNHDPGSGTQAYEVDHISDNGSGGYTWQMYTGFDADASAKASFLRAFETWRCGTYINWTIGSTTSTNSTGSDGVNVIRFDSGAELSVGVLGTCYSYRSGCNPGSGIIWYVTELDIVFDDGATWGYGPAAPAFSEYDFETVALHELGHGHQLGHVISSGAIMHYAISNGTSNRTLGTNDLNGGNYVQAKSIVANACGPGAMTNYTGCTVAPVAAFTVNSTTLCPNGTVSFTDQSTNTPTSWSWVFQGGTPSTSTVQNPTISYSALGVYSVTLTATNGAGSDSEIKAGYITVTSSGCIATTSLSAGHCGSSPATYLTPIYFDNVQGASDYEILLTNSSLGYSKSTTLGKGWQPYFYLVSYNDITTSTTYSVQVRAKVGSSWGSYGTSCNITTPALPTTSLTGGYCGYASPTYLTPIYFNSVPGAIDYEILLTNSTLGYSKSTTLGKGWQDFFYLISYNNLSSATTYSVQVRPKLGGSWASYGSVCTVTTPGSIPTSSLTPAYCGYSAPSVVTPIFFDNVAGAIDYEILLTNTSLGYSKSITLGKGWQPYFYLVSFNDILSATTYSVQVRPKVSGTWGTYGAICTVTTPSVPTTSLTPAYCGYTSTSFYQPFYFHSVPGALNYEVLFTNSTLGYSVAMKTVYTSNSAYYPIGFPNLQTSTTYSVQVRALVGGSWGNYGSTCTMTTHSAFNKTDDSNSFEDGNFVEKDNSASINIFPNPTNQNFIYFSLNSSEFSFDENVDILVYDLNGRLVYHNSLPAQTNKDEVYQIGLENFNNGMYLLKVISNTSSSTQRFIVDF